MQKRVITLLMVIVGASLGFPFYLRLGRQSVNNQMDG